MYKDSWIIVANKSKARFFKALSNTEIKEEFSLFHSKSRNKGGEIDTDRPGRSFDSVGPGRHHVGNHDPGEEEAQIFAKEISDKLYELEEGNKISKLYLIASPKMLGLITDKLHPNLKQRLADKLDKDLTAMEPKKIRDYLPYVI